MRVLDEEQVRLFLAEARRSSPHYALYLAAIMTGMRQGELMGLRWRDVDLVLGVAAIQQTFYQMGKQQFFRSPRLPDLGGT
jgi:integrase